MADGIGSFVNIKAFPTPHQADPYDHHCGPAFFDKGVVHRHHDHEVFLGSPRVSDGEVSFGFHIDPSHRELATCNDEVPFVVMVEASRQLGIAASHVLGGIPLEMAAVATRLGFSWTVEPVSLGVLTSSHTRSTVCFSRFSSAPDGTYVVDLESRITFRRKLVGTAWGAITWVNQRAYRKLRSRGVLNTTANTFQEPNFIANELHTPRWVQGHLTWDYANTFYFDHHSDHVPGMVFAAGALEAHRLLPKAGPPRYIDLNFTQYGELDKPVKIESELDNPRNPRGTCATFTQDNKAICTATIHGNQGILNQ